MPHDSSVTACSGYTEVIPAKTECRTGRSKTFGCKVTE